ncbi:MAG: hypothetical protein ABI794_13375 [Betaproteobacteria bacterium]
MRSRIAHLAARLMAQDGVDDFALAKRKAARQVGAPDTRNLPDNAEIEDALRAYQQLYQAEEQAERVAALRRAALEMMCELQAFDPHLVGPVLSGSAGRYADVDLHLFTDNAKEVEMYLINEGVDFRTREGRFWAGDELRMVPSYEFETPEARFTVTVFGSRDLRGPLRATPEGRPIERVRSGWIASSLSETVGITPD